ncbi:HET-domain-containing protein [Zalerion maritima]|uniref:HET-domain-containing protein n=1 Tax=Zalerion maritima TaxID=339359 RepID=A0AAD5RH15_9PEZI|nr:HET-domain-containing protein [Zalerion maritima]
MSRGIFSVGLNCSFSHSHHAEKEGGVSLKKFGCTVAAYATLMAPYAVGIVGLVPVLLAAGCGPGAYIRCIHGRSRSGHPASRCEHEGFDLVFLHFLAIHQAMDISLPEKHPPLFGPSYPLDPPQHCRGFPTMIRITAPALTFPAATPIRPRPVPKPALPKRRQEASFPNSLATPVPPSL